MSIRHQSIVMLFLLHTGGPPATAGTTDGTVHTEVYSNYEMKHETQNSDHSNNDSKKSNKSSSQKDKGTAESQSGQTWPRPISDKMTTDRSLAQNQAGKQQGNDKLIYKDYQWTSPDGSASGFFQSWTSADDVPVVQLRRHRMFHIEQHWNTDSSIPVDRNIQRK